MLTAVGTTTAERERGRSSERPRVFELDRGTVRRSSRSHWKITSRPCDVPGDGGFGRFGASVMAWKYTD